MVADGYGAGLSQRVPMSTFADLPLDPQLLANVATLGFDAPTTIQEIGIPVMMEGRDVVGRARTGSGKTAAFGLPLVQKLIGRKSGIGALVLAPTRELALQVTDALRSFAQGMDLPMVTLYGGAPYGPQLDALRRGVAVVVGTPGRVLDHLQRGTLDLSSVGMVVLDEADEMLRMGFIDDVEAILTAVPRPRQVALFSATMPDPIRRVAETHLVDPVEVGASDERPRTDHVTQVWIKCTQRRKLDALQRVLAGESDGATLVFARTRASCADVADELSRRGVAVDALHGDLSQSARERVLGRLREKRLNVVVATDVASRGIDVDHITHVVNFDLPTDADTYVHRIGRTGRAGREGKAITLVTPAEIAKIRRWSRELRVEINQVEAPNDASIAERKRRRLDERLRAALTEGDAARARTIVERALADGWEAHELAVAAITLLTDPNGLAQPDDVPAPPPLPPERFERDRFERPERLERPERAPSFDARPTDGEERRPRPERHRDPFSGDGMVELFIPVGRVRGVRPGDLVGAIANDYGVSGSDIGKVTVVDHKSFVEVPAPVAERIVSAGSLVLRGEPVPVDRARPRLTEGRPPARKMGPPRRTPFPNPKGKR